MRRGTGCLLLALLPIGCELAQVTTAIPESVVIAEIYFRVDDDRANGLALLHRTSGFEGEGVVGALIRVRRAGGKWVDFVQESAPNCTEADLPESFVPACYLLDEDEAEGVVVPRARLEVEVELPGGGLLRGTTTVPGDFEVREPLGAPELCSLPAETRLPMAWTRAEGAWAYFAEAEILGLRNALAPKGIVVRTDPITLQGLSISEADTTIIFPSEFGVFNRFSDDSEILLAIQDGLPPSTNAFMVVSALDRNATNWVRGGNFNPSGQIRVPSLFGDGTGVVGSVVNRVARIQIRDPEGDDRRCLRNPTPTAPS